MDNDHRRLGRELRLFDTSPVIGAGLPMWMPDGAIIRTELERFAAEQAERSGCRRIFTPVLAKRELFERSGHWDKFAEDMFPPMRVGGEELVLRPANCPSHVQVYAAEQHSWRDLPVRYAENAAMFRSELSGVLGGLSRVRQITLDDAHVFCRPDQVVAEVVLALDAIRAAYAILGIEIDHHRLSVRGEHGAYAGTDEDWRLAEAELESALREAGVAFRRAPGEAAFYGPKIDVQVRDAGGREETLSTVQIDRVMPERFELSYVSPAGVRARPVMVHRGLLSSMERLVALLIEQYEGRFPTWLAPHQVDVLPVDPRRHDEAAQDALRRLRAAAVRARVSADGSLGSRIRGAHRDRVAYIAVLGDAEIADDALSVNGAAIGVEPFIAAVTAEIATRALHPGL